MPKLKSPSSKPRKGLGVLAVDTNVVVRFLTRDDPAQYRASYKLFSSEQLFIPDTVVLECEWVLRAAYDLKPNEVCDVFRNVFGMPNVTLTNAQQVSRAIEWHEQGIDFADAFHLSLSQELLCMKTFDADFVKRAKSKGTCRVESRNYFD
jgi:predicted nucleic-acid-binding protein